jgi:hypothetical protein
MLTLEHKNRSEVLTMEHKIPERAEVLHTEFARAEVINLEHALRAQEPNLKHTRAEVAVSGACKS